MAHSAFGLMGYSLRTHSGSRNNNIVKYSYRAGPTLVKIFQGSLKILEDLHEDPSADL